MVLQTEEGLELRGMLPGMCLTLLIYTLKMIKLAIYCHVFITTVLKTTFNNMFAYMLIRYMQYMCKCIDIFIVEKEKWAKQRRKMLIMLIINIGNVNNCELRCVYVLFSTLE